MDDGLTMKVGMRLGLFGAGIAAVLATGCQSRSAAARNDGKQTATYRGRILSTDLPDGVRVPAVAIAAEMSLRRRGYAVTKAGTEDYARVEGEAPNAGMLERVVVRTRQTASRTRVEIIAQPLGDQVLSRAILAEMMGALGLRTDQGQMTNRGEDAPG